MIKKIPAITIYQPWASLLAHGHKIYETRDWEPPKQYIGGFMAIHAGKRWTNREQRFWAAYQKMYPALANLPVPLGAILAVCKLVEIVPSELLVDNVSNKERLFGNFDPGRFGWKLEVVIQFKKEIPATGYQGIWNWEVEL